MSPEADVLEMKGVFEQLAELLLPRGTDTACAHAIFNEFRTDGENGKPLFTRNRAFELLKGLARRVDGFEKDNAKRRLAALRKVKADNALEQSQATYRVLEARLAALEALYERIDPEHASQFMAAYKSQARGQGEGSP
jgi:hypothetical protein